MGFVPRRLWWSAPIVPSACRYRRIGYAAACTAWIPQGLYLKGIFRGSLELEFLLPRHVQDRLGLKAGQELEIALKPRYLHLLPEAGYPRNLRCN